ncbi:MAG: UvrABC system protein C [Microgenomates bacterium OLB23]|nr:MAG: UvrABC system protein C [Microgenomates bacterium OLB23]
MANIRKVIHILSGKTNTFAKSLEQELKKLSHEQKYEEAITVRNKLFQFAFFLDKRSFSEESLGVNIDVDELQSQVLNFLHTHFKKPFQETYRIECYDISNLFGEQPTASMVSF